VKPRVFVDTSVLFAASHSRSGSAHDLVRAAVRREVDLWASQYVLDEVTRNLGRKSPGGLLVLESITLAGLLPVLDPDLERIERIAELIERKDAPVIAGALAVGASIVVTYDRRHLLSRAELIRSTFGLDVVTPDEVLRRLAADDEGPAS